MKFPNVVLEITSRSEKQFRKLCEKCHLDVLRRVPGGNDFLPSFLVDKLTIIFQTGHPLVIPSVFKFHVHIYI